MQIVRRRLSIAQTQPLGEWPVFLLALAVVPAAAFAGMRAGGLTVLLVAVLMFERRLFSAKTIVLMAGIATQILLRKFGNWYAGHEVSAFATGVTAAAVALWSVPAVLRETIQSWPPLKIAILAAAAPTLLFQLGNNPTITPGDTQPLLPTVVQMLRHGSRDLSGWPANGRWSRYEVDGGLYFLRQGSSGKGLYSAYPAGMELFALPGVVIAWVWGANVDDAGVLSHLERITACVVTAATMGGFFLLAARFVKLQTAYVMTLFLATGSAFASTTGQALWQQNGVAFWMVVVLLCEAHHRGRWIQAFACAMMLVCRPSAVTFLLPFGVWMMMRDTRRALLLTLQSLLCYLPWAWMNRSITGSLFGPSMSLLNQEWTAAGSLSGILFSPARGVFVYQPWLFLLFALRRSRLIPWWPLLVSAVFLQTLLVASWPMWWGGHCYGSRLLTETVPLLGLLLLKPLDNILAKSWGCWLAGTLVVLGLMLHLPGSHGSAMGWNFTPASIDEQTERLWDWRHPPFLFDWQR